MENGEIYGIIQPRRSKPLSLAKEAAVLNGKRLEGRGFAYSGVGNASGLVLAYHHYQVLTYA